MSVLAVIPARGGSKGIPRKNIKKLAGKPLIGWTIEAAKKADCIDRIVVSTDDEEISNVAIEFGAEVPFHRPANLSTDEAPGVSTALHALNNLPGYDWILLLQPTSPLRAIEDIDAIWRLCVERHASSAVSVTEVSKHPLWMFKRRSDGSLEQFLPGMQTLARRQELPKAYALNGALYLARTEWVLSHQRLVGPDTLGYVMPAERSVDIDTQYDWLWVEYLMGRKK